LLGPEALYHFEIECRELSNMDFVLALLQL